MKKAALLRVSFGDEGGFARAKRRKHCVIQDLGVRVNALDANAHASRKRTLNGVVEVQYTTDLLEVAE
jgi:hypothetical protein